MNRSQLPRRRAAAWLAALACACGVASAAPVQWSAAAGGNDHWYEYVPAASIFDPVTFDAARSGALSRTHQGLQGYLANVSSAAEQAFIESAGFAFLYGFNRSSIAYLGGSDAAVEGEWRWLDGPEAGQLVGYTNWLPGQPVSAAGFEDHDLMSLNVNAVVLGLPPAFGWASQQLSSRAFGYIVEYGSSTDGGGPTDPHPVPEPPALLLAAAALLLASRRRVRA